MCSDRRRRAVSFTSPAILPCRCAGRCRSCAPTRKPGWIEVLYKVVGPGLRHLSTRRAGDVVSTMGPIGVGFVPHADRPRTLLVGGGVGIPPMVFLAERLRDSRDAKWQPLVLMGSEIPFPFRARPSTIIVPGIPAGVIACMPLLDDWGIPSRLASFADFAGCFHGYVTSLASTWLASLPSEELSQVEMFACGPTPMLKAAAAVARQFDIACQVSLEEFMACAVGGCAGCTVLVQTDTRARDEARLRRWAGIRRAYSVLVRRADERPDRSDQKRIVMPSCGPCDTTSYTKPSSS